MVLSPFLSDIFKHITKKSDIKQNSENKLFFCKKTQTFLPFTKGRRTQKTDSMKKPGCLTRL
ncbi:MAG TPA: hypothetical protein DE060_21035 [Lentisphaeria bacterium]|nr:hypothetical protein [Lentisphaeria bacterium]